MKALASNVSFLKSFRNSFTASLELAKSFNRNMSGGENGRSPKLKKSEARFAALFVCLL